MAFFVDNASILRDEKCPPHVNYNLIEAMPTEESLEAWQLNRKPYWNQGEKRGWFFSVAPTDWTNNVESYLA